MGDVQELVPDTNLKLMTSASASASTVPSVQEAGRGYVTVSVLLSCGSCSKSFGSQQALDVHMMAHANLRPKNRSQALAANELEAKPICNVCGRSFRSMKSLFGHLRCHPERQYRGIKDPKEKSTTIAAALSTSCYDSSSSSSSLDESNLIKSSLPSNWSITGKRGRISISSGATTATPISTEGEEVNDEDERILEAAENLLWFACSNSFSINHHGQAQFLSPEIGSTSITSLTMEVVDLVLPNIDQEQRMITTHFDIKKKIMMGKRKLVEQDDTSSNKRIHLDSMGLITSDDDDQKYFKCNVCNKCFPTHQALGGHKSSHNKHMTKIQNPTSRDDNVTNPQQSSDFTIKIKLTSSNSIINSTPHQCKICSKIFLTGQALGGHMRAHVTENQENSSGQTNSPVETCSQPAQKVFAFDLNELPPIDQGEGDVANGYVGASSSYSYYN